LHNIFQRNLLFGLRLRLVLPCYIGWSHSAIVAPNVASTYLANLMMVELMPTNTGRVNDHWNGHFTLPVFKALADPEDQRPRENVNG
jgi:hypothetical protein